MKSALQVACRGFALTVLLFVPLAGLHAQQRWTEAQANAWYAAQPWPVGANFLPSTAINELEMWQADTFDPKTIDRELGWAEGIGMNTMRVFLHNLLWEQDAEGFKQRIDTFLTIAARHHIRPVFVLFLSLIHISCEPNGELFPGFQRVAERSRKDFGGGLSLPADKGVWEIHACLLSGFQPIVYPEMAE